MRFVRLTRPCPQRCPEMALAQNCYLAAAFAVGPRARGRYIGLRNLQTPARDEVARWQRRKGSPRLQKRPAQRSATAMSSACPRTSSTTAPTARPAPPPSPRRQAQRLSLSPTQSMRAVVDALAQADTDTGRMTRPSRRPRSRHRTPAGARSLSSEKAQRIVEAMRVSVARRGTAGSTFEKISREAGVSRGLLHYYFGTKEQLLVQAVRRECELRLELLERQLANAQTADDFIELMAENLRETVRKDPDFVTLVFELFTLSRRNEDIAAEFAALLRGTRHHLAGMLDAAQREGVVHLHAEPEAVAETLFSLADGLALRMLAEPERDFSAAIRAGIACARALLTD